MTVAFRSLITFTAMCRLSSDIRDGGRTATRSVRLRQGLIIGQIAMTVMLLSAAGLLTRSLAALSAVNTGVRTSDVLSMRVGLPGIRYTPPQRVEFFRQASEQLQRLPGVQSVGVGISIPVFVGAALGLMGAFGMSRFIETLLYGVTSYDPLTFAGITVLLFAVSILATVVPARQATKVDPLVALRQD